MESRAAVREELPRHLTGVLCCADAYEHGEAQSGDGSIPGDEFQGFHRIENYLFRDGVVEPAVPYAEGLLMLWDALIEALSNPSSFNFCGCAARSQHLSSSVDKQQSNVRRLAR